MSLWYEKPEDRVPNDGNDVLRGRKRAVSAPKTPALFDHAFRDIVPQPAHSYGLKSHGTQTAAEVARGAMPKTR